MSYRFMKRNIAIITGATSGIGKSFAEQLAAKNIDLYILGRREQLLHSLAEDLKKRYAINVTVIIGDLSQRSFVDELCEKFDTLSNIEYLINNAGYGNRDSFFNEAYESQEKMLEVHIYALTKLVHVVGNKMREQLFGNIINTSSLASFFPIPTGEFYSSTKAFINIFSESTHIDLRNYNIHVQALCPGFTYTDFHRKLEIDDEKRKNRFLIRWMSADRVAEISLNSLKKKDKVIVIPGFTNKLLYLISKFIPKKLYYRNAGTSVKLPGKKEI